jgi:DNA repair protein RadC
MMTKRQIPKAKGISSWPEEERPRERLLNRGPEAVSDAELVAILLRTGVKGTSAVELARRVLDRFGSLADLLRAPVYALLEEKGLKGAKAAQLIAAIELARRASIPPEKNKLRLNSTQAVIEYLQSRMINLPDEQFRVLYLNRVHGLLADVVIAQGDVGSVRPSIRTIMGRALQANASGMILCHNHPSGVPEPSESDRLLTRDVLTGARPLQIRVLDHVILGERGAFSFADSGLLEELAIEAGVV